MKIIFHPHAINRAHERGASESEIIETVNHGEQFPAKFDRNGYRMNFHFEGIWNDKFYFTKQIEAYTINEKDTIIIITMIVKYF